MATRTRQFYEVLNAAIRDIAEHGFDSEARLLQWQQRLQEAARSSLIPPATFRRRLNEFYRSIYRRQVERGEVLKLHPGVPLFTVDKLKPQLRDTLERYMLASANLIVLNQEKAIQQTVQRFAGWASSIPKGGSKSVDKSKEKDNLRKGLASLPFEERRVLIDQGHKFTSALSEVVAVDGGALGAFWRSNWRQANYDYREEHKERDGEFYTMRGNWAILKGLMKKGPAGFTDEITKPGEDVFCRCKYQWIYNLRSVPEYCLTKKGKDALASARAARAA